MPAQPVQPMEGSLATLLFEAAPDAMVVIGASGRITYINQQAEVMFGWTRDEIVGQFIEKLIPDRFRQRHVLHRDGYFAYPRIRPMGLGLSLYGQTKEGQEFPVEISLAPIQENYAVATVRDITAWRRIAATGAEPLRPTIPATVVYLFMGAVLASLILLVALTVNAH